MKAKALTSFFSKEHGSVSIGDTMNFQNQETMQEYVNAGYVEEMSDDMAVPTQSATEAPKTRNARKAKATASDVEFSQELGATNAPNQMGKATKQTQANAKVQANANDVEFSQELGAVSNAQVQANKAEVAKNANEMNDMNENNK